MWIFQFSFCRWFFASFHYGQKRYLVILVFINLGFFCGLTCNLSWRILHMHLRRMYTLLFWGIVFYMSVRSNWSAVWFNTCVSLLIFCLAVLSPFVFIPRYGCTTVCLTIHPLKDIWIVSCFQLWILGSFNSSFLKSRPQLPLSRWSFKFLTCFCCVLQKPSPCWKWKLFSIFLTTTKINLYIAFIQPPSIFNCLLDISTLMSHNYLKFNLSKTEPIIQSCCYVFYILYQCRYHSIEKLGS